MLVPEQPRAVRPGPRRGRLGQRGRLGRQRGLEARWLLAVAVALLTCSSLALSIGSASAATTSTVVPHPSTTTTTRPKPPTTTTALPTTSSTTTTKPPTSTTSSPPSTVTTGPVSSTTTTTTPQHIVNQPNLDALSPHVTVLSGPGVQYQYSSGPTTQGSHDGVPSFMSSPGGPYIYDSNGRMVLMHGTNVVYKHPPYIAYPDPGQPWNFSASDAARMQKLGFNVVRLGIEWQGLEPGSGGPNQPNVCTPGAPGNPHEFNLTVAEPVPQARRCDGEAAEQVRHLHAARHASGRLQPALPGRGCSRLGRVHQQRAHRAQGRPLVEQLFERTVADRRAALLGERRRGQPAGTVRSGLEDRGRLLQEQPLGRGL